MGCDIHARAEAFEDGKWQLLEKVFEDPYAEYRENKDEKISSPYNMRNYSLFALLANVRNSDNIDPIDAPRGVPEDASKKYKKYIDQWGIDGHSHSYFTLEELLAFNCDRIIDRSGIVSNEEYQKIKSQGCPESWSGGVFGGSIFMISNEEMDEYIDNPELFVAMKLGILLADRHQEWGRGGQNMRNSPAFEGLLEKIKEYEEIGTTEAQFYTEGHWKQSLKDCVGSWWFDKTLPRLQELAPDGDPTKIRMVFFFDN